MPANWGSKGLTETGFNAIIYFAGRITSIEEDLPSDYPNNDGSPRLQTKFNFSEVELLAWEAPVTLNEPTLTKYVNQTQSKRSTWGRMQTDLEAFANRKHLEGPLPDCIVGTTFVFGRKIYPMGNNVGMAWVPVDTIDNVEKYRKGKVEPGSVDTGLASGDKSKAKSDIPDSLDDVLLDFLNETLSETEGISVDNLKKAIVGKRATRTAMGEAGGIESVVKFLLSKTVAVETDGLLFKVDQGKQDKDPEPEEAPV